MKKLIIAFSLMLYFFHYGNAQSNPGFSYQAVARDAMGQVMKNEQLDLRFTIIKDDTDTGNGTVIYRESHQTTTNEYGLFNLIVGKGDSLFGDFNKVNWRLSNLFLQVGIDLDGNNQFSFMGKSKILPVPLALHALSAENVDDADADATNELQLLSFDTSTSTLSLSDGNSIILPKTAGGSDADGDPTNEIQVLNQNGLNVSLSDGGGSISVADNDNDATNELQSLNRTGDLISLSDGGGSFVDQTEDADASPTNEIQVLGFDPSTAVLQLSNGGGQIDLSSLRNSNGGGSGSDDQKLSLNGTVLSIEDGNSIDLGALPINDADADAQNELQQLSFDTSTYMLQLSDGNQVDLSSLKSFGGNGSTQNLSLNGTTLGISGGNTVDLSNLPDQVDDADADAGNELQALSRNGLDLSLSNGGGTISIADNDNDPNNEIQLLTKNGLEINLSGGGGIVSVADNDNDAANELQTLSLAGDSLALSDGNTVDLSSLSKDDADANPQNELQQMSYNTNTNILELSQNGGTVDLSGLANGQGAGNNQSLSLNGNILGISDGNTVNLDSLASPWERKMGFIEYVNGKTRVEELYAQSGDTLVRLNKESLLLDQVPGVIGDETIVDHEGFRSFETLTEYTQLNADSLYFTYAPDFFSNFRDVRSSTFTPEKLTIEDSLEVAKLTSNGLKFDFSENTGDYAYYGHDSLAFANNVNFLAPFFSNMDANKVELWSSGGESRHYAGSSEYLFADRKVVVSGFGVLGTGESGGTTYDQFRLEADEFIMRNDVRFPTFDFKTLPNGNAAEFNMYPGTGLPAYFTLGPSPIDAAAAQLTMQSNNNRSVCLAGHNGVGELCLYNNGRTAFQMSAENIFGGSQLTMFDNSELEAVKLFINQNNNPELEMRTGRFRMTTSLGVPSLELSTASDAGQINLFGPNGNTNVYGGPFLDANYGSLGVYGANGLPNVWMVGSENGGLLSVLDTNFITKVSTYVEAGAGKQYFYGSNGNPNVQIGTFGNVDRGIIAVNNENGSGLATMSITDQGGANVLARTSGAPGISSFINGDDFAEIDLFNGMFRVYNPSNILAMEANAINGSGALNVFGANSQLNASIGSIFDDNRGTFRLFDETGAFNLLLYQDDEGGKWDIFSKNNGGGVAAFIENKAGKMDFIGPNGKKNLSVGESFTSADHGLLNIYNDAELAQVAFSSTANGGAMRMSRPNANFALDAYVDGSNNAHLDVFGGFLGVRTLNNLPAVEAKSINGHGEMDFYGSNGLLNVQISNGFTSADHGLLNIYNDAELAQVAFSSTANGGAMRMSRPNANFALDAYVDGSNNARLDIFGGTLGVRTLNNLPAVEAKSTSGFGELTLYGADNQAYLTTGAFGTNNNNGALFVNNSSGSTAIGLSTNDNGGVFFVSNTNTFATISAGTDGSDPNRVLLDIGDGDFEITNGEVLVKQDFSTNVGRMYPLASTGQLELNGSNGNLNVTLGTVPLFGDLDRGALGVHGTDGAYQVYATSNVNGGLLNVNDDANSTRAGFFVDDFGNGVVFADIKNFKMDHPEDPTKEIWYVSLEGPEAAAYERGTGNLEDGEAFIPFSEHYGLVANPETMTVQVTPLSAESTGLAVVRKTKEGFYVKELFKGSGSYEFDWEVKAVRRGHENFQPVRDKK